jgi:hypothetical protein
MPVMTCGDSVAKHTYRAAHRDVCHLVRRMLATSRYAEQVYQQTARSCHMPTLAYTAEAVIQLLDAYETDATRRRDTHAEV